jgi:DNA gyrase subunit A
VFAIDRNTVKQEGSGYVITCTANSMVKRSELNALPTAPGQGFVACGVNDGDYVIRASMTKGDEEVMLFSQSGMAIRFKQDDVRPMGLPAGGVLGMKLDEGDIVMAMALVQQSYPVEHDVVLATTDGKAKRTSIDDYPIQGRAGKGVMCVKLLKDATLADATITSSEAMIVYITVKGNAKSLKAKNLKRLGRAAAGEDAMSMGGGSDRLARLVV